MNNSEVYKYASVADVQCVPTLVEEAAGLVLMEAMAEGLPTIVTNSGGIIEYVNKDSTLIVEREEIIANLKKTIMYLKERPEVRTRMSEESKIQSKKFDEEIYYRNFVELIDKIMDKKRENENGN